MQRVSGSKFPFYKKEKDSAEHFCVLRAMISRELCAAKRNLHPLNIYKKDEEEESGYSLIDTEHHTSWGGSDACQVIYVKSS